MRELTQERLELLSYSHEASEPDVLYFPRPQTKQATMASQLPESISGGITSVTSGRSYSSQDIVSVSAFKVFVRYSCCRATPGPARMKVSSETCPVDIKHVEHVEVYVNASFCVRGFLRLTVESPLGTKSVVSASGCVRDGLSTAFRLRFLECFAPQTRCCCRYSPVAWQTTGPSS